MSENEIFEALFELAKTSSDTEGVVAAALVRDGKLLIALPSSDDGVFHAEYLVIDRARKNGIKILPTDTLYTTVEPCSRRSPGRSVSDCTSAILNTSIKRVVYGASDPAQTTATQQRMLLGDIMCEQVTNHAIREKSRDIFNSTQLNPDKSLI